MNEIHVIDNEWRMNNADYLVYSLTSTYDKIIITFRLP